MIIFNAKAQRFKGAEEKEEFAFLCGLCVSAPLR
jgi:hypothetical protein